MNDYKQTAISLAQQAGKIMQDHFTLAMAKDWKSDGTPVTVADTTINDLVINTIAATYPDHAVLGEERSHNLDADAEYVWVLDPIDGTIPFSHGIPIFVFSLALTHKGESILGVLYDPSLGRMLVAEKGKGAFLNTTPQQISNQAPHDQPVYVSTSDTPAQTLIEVQSWRGYQPNLNPLKDILIQQGAQVTTICTVLYAAMLVALGEYGAVIFSGTKPWDAAAAKIIVEEAGGHVTDLAGNDQRYDRPMNGVIISNGKLHNELVKLVGQLSA